MLYACNMNVVHKILNSSLGIKYIIIVYYEKYS